MIAVDTNVVVRLLTGDDPRQADRARALFSTELIWLSKTVLLEAEWVLRSLYGFDDASIRETFLKLIGLRNVHVEAQASLRQALDLWSHGVDFADALHLCSRPSGATFASFDRALVRRATRAGVPGVSATW